MKTLNKKIIDRLEKNDFRICGIYEQDGEFFVELETYSPAGEDFIATIWYDGTSKDFINAFYEYAIGFDPDEHAEFWVESRGKNGVPESIRELIEDADAINDILMKTAAELAA